MVQVSGHHGAGRAADALAPGQQLFRAPSLPAMGLRHMLCLRGEAILLLSNVVNARIVGRFGDADAFLDCFNV